VLILIHSPHLDRHPLSSEKRKKKARKGEDMMKTQSADSDGSGSLKILAPMEIPSSPSLQAMRFTEDVSKSTYDLATELLPPGAAAENIMPFQLAGSLVPMLRQLEPEVVYFEENVLGGDGEEEAKVVEELLSRASVGRVVVVIGGDDEIGGLVSSDDEVAVERRRGVGKWWGEGGRVREMFGKRLEVVEGWVLEEDWRRRVEEVDA
jgi:hypothetical protein